MERQQDSCLFPLGSYIKGYIEKYGEVNPYTIYSLLKHFRAEESYQNIKNYFWWLTKLGLIEPARKEKAKIGYKTFYRLTSKGLSLSPDNVMWANPRRALYPKSWKKG
ncbi:MAG: hypothetical protein C0193_02440 [Candidatus Bathyarchaeota archaeon]|nr:MAG: hypothetical protein C0193_02440 [Candidatus Bathyarchaeota archaeon]